MFVEYWSCTRTLAGQGIGTKQGRVFTQVWAIFATEALDQRRKSKIWTDFNRLQRISSMTDSPTELIRRILLPPKLHFYVFYKACVSHQKPDTESSLAVAAATILLSKITLSNYLYLMHYLELITSNRTNIIIAILTWTALRDSMLWTTENIMEVNRTGLWPVPYSVQV